MFIMQLLLPTHRLRLDYHGGYINKRWSIGCEQRVNFSSGKYSGEWNSCFQIQIEKTQQPSYKMKYGSWLLSINCRWAGWGWQTNLLSFQCQVGVLFFFFAACGTEASWNLKRSSFLRALRMHHNTHFETSVRFFCKLKANDLYVIFLLSILGGGALFLNFFSVSVFQSFQFYGGVSPPRFFKICLKGGVNLSCFFLFRFIDFFSIF